MLSVLVITIRPRARLDHILWNVTVSVQLPLIYVMILSILLVILFGCWIVSWAKVWTETTCCLESLYCWAKELMLLELEVLTELVVCALVWARTRAFVFVIDHFPQLHLERIRCLVNFSLKLGLQWLWSKNSGLAFGSLLFLLSLNLINQLKLMLLMKGFFLQRLESLLFIQAPTWPFALGFLFRLLRISLHRIRKKRGFPPLNIVF